MSVDYRFVDTPDLVVCQNCGEVFIDGIDPDTGLCAGCTSGEG